MIKYLRHIKHKYILINTNYHDQISTHLTNDAKGKLEVDQIARMARDKIGWFQSVAPKKPAR